MVSMEMDRSLRALEERKSPPRRCAEGRERENKPFDVEINKVVFGKKKLHRDPRLAKNIRAKINEIKSPVVLGVGSGWLIYIDRDESYHR